MNFWRKIGGLLCAGVLFTGMTACGSTETVTDSIVETEETVTESSAQEETVIASESSAKETSQMESESTDTEAEQSKILVVYFSATGNTSFLSQPDNLVAGLRNLW